MATTGENLRDGLVWMRKLLVVWLRWGLVLGLAFGLFGLAVWLTRGEDFGNCGDVPAEQRAALESLTSPTDPPACTRGVYAARLVGIDGRLNEALTRLGTSGWTQDAQFLPLFYDLDVRCLRSDRPEWSGLELNLVAGRDGRIVRTEARATGTEQPCTRVRCSSLSTGCAWSDVIG